MQSSQVRNVGLPSSADTKRDVPAWTQDPKIFPLDWFSVSRPNIIRQTKEYVSELSKWRNCPKIKTLSKLKAVLKRIMMFLHTHITYIDGKSLLECDLEEDLITLVSLYMDMELRVLLIKKSATSGASSTTLAGPVADADADTARNDKLVSDRIAYWLYTVLTGHDQRVDALLSTTVFTRHTRPVLDPIFRKVLSEMSDGPFTNVNYVRHMLAYKTWRERTLVLDDTASLELNSRVLQQLVPRDYAFPPPLLRCLGKGDNAREHARPHNINLADACRNFMRYCREIPAAAAEQINFESIPLFDDDLLGDEEGEVNKIMNMISSRKQRKTASLSPRRNSQVDAFIDLTVPKSRTGAICGNTTSLSDVIDLTEEDEKPIITSRTAAVVEHSAPTPLRTPAVQRISTSKKQQPSQDCSYSMAPSTPQVETRCFTAYRDQDIYLVNISCMCPVRAHRQRECQCQDKKIGYHKENKALKALTERKCENDATFVGRCFQFSIGNQYAYPSEDDVDTEMQPLVVGNSQDQVKLEMRASNAVTCNKDESRDEATEFCDKLFSASLNHCDCDGCKRRDSLSRYENRTCSSAASNDSKTEISDNVQCRQKSLVTYSHTPSVADMYAMDKANPIVLHSQTSAQLPEDRNQVEYFPETLDKRKLPSNESNDYFTPREDTLNNNFRNEIRKIKLPIVQTVTDKRPDNVILSNEDIFPVESEPIVLGTIEEISKSTNITDKISTITENSESQKLPPVDFSKETTDLDKTNTQNKTSPLVSDSRTEIEQLCSEITDLSYSEHLEKEIEVTETTCNVLEKDCVPDETVNSNFEEREDIHCTDTLIEDQKIEELTDILSPGETNDLKTVNTTLSNIEEREDINCTVAPIEDQKIEEETVLLPQHTNDLEVLEELEQTNEQEIVSTDLLENRKRQIVVGKEITITEETDTHLTSKVSEEFEACTQENRNEQENCETQILFNKEITITDENNTHLTSNDSKEFENCSSQEITNKQENMGTEILENCETQTPVNKEVTITEGTDALLEQNYLSNEIGEISSQTEIESNILSENILTNENKVIEEPISNISVINEEKIDDTPTEKTIIEETVYCFSEMITELNEDESISECLNLPDYTESVAIEANVSSEDISTNEIIITEKPISVIEETKPVEKINTEEYVCENKNIHYSFHDNASSTKLQDIEETAPVVEIVVESEIPVAGIHEIETTNQINSKDHIINDHSEDNNEDASLETEIVHEIHEIETENHPVAAIHEIETTIKKTSSDIIITDQLSTEKKDYVQETEICAEIVHEIEGTTQSVADIHEIETTNQQSSSDCIATHQSSTNKDFVQDTEICAEFAHDTEATTQPVAALHEIETTNQHSITIDLSSTNKEDCVQDTEICTDIGHDIEATPQSVVDIHEIKTTNQQSSSDCNTTDQSSINKEDFVQDTEICTEIHHAIEATSQPVAAIHEIETTNQQFNSDSITIDQSTTNNDDFVQEYEICTEIDHEIEETPQSFADTHEVETTNRQSSSDCITTDQSSTNKEYFVQETEICHEIATNEHVAAIHEIETTNLQSNSDSINIDESITNKEHFVQETEICAEIVREIEATCQPVAAIHEIEATKQQCDLDSISTDQLSTNNENFVKETEICTEFAQEIEATTQPVAATHEIEATNEQSNLDSISTDQLSTNNEDFMKETEICTEFAQEIEAASLPVAATHEIEATNQPSNLDYISTDQLSTNNEDFVKETKICTEFAHEIEATSQPVAAVHEIETTNLQYNSVFISTGQLNTSNEDFVKETEICAEFAQEIEATSQPVAANHEIEINNQQSNSDSINIEQSSTNKEYFVQKTEISVEIVREIEATCQPVAAIHEIETTKQSNSDSITIDQPCTNKEYFLKETEISTEIVHEIETNQQSNSDSITTDQLSTNNEVFVKETEFAHEIKATSQPIVAIHEIETTNQQSYSDSVTIDQSSTNKEHFVHETEICAEIVHEIEATNQQSNLDSISSDQLSTNNEDFVKETEICSEFIHEIEGTSLPIPAIREIESTNSDSSANKEDFVEETEIIHEIEITQQSKSSDTIVTEICTDVSHGVEAINLSASSDIVDNSSTNFEDFIPGTIITADTAQVIETINQQPNPDSIVDTNFEEIIPKIEIVHVPMSKRKRRTSIRDHVEEEVQIDVPKMSPTKRRRCKTSIEATNEEKEKIDVPLHEETSFKINNLTEISNSEIAEENTEVLYTQLETSVEKSAKKTIPFKESNLVYNSEETQQKIAPKERASKKRRKTNLNVRKDKKSMKETSKSEKIDSTEDKKLIIRCERLSLKDIEHLSKLNRTTCDNDTKIPAKENINKMRLTSRRKNQIAAPTNNLKEDTITQEATVKNEQNKINSNSEKNNINKNVDIPSFSEFVSKEKEKQGKIKGRPRKKKQIDNNENTNKPSENQITNTISNLVDVNTEIKIKRPRGRPPKNSFFSENLNLQNVNSKNTNVLVNGNDTHCQTIPDEDVPLLVRKCLSPKRNSLKISQKNSISDLENNINNEDDLPLLSRKQKLKPNKIVKTYSAKTKLKKALRKEGSDRLIKQTELRNEVKSKSFRDKLNQFKYKPRSKTDQEDIAISPKKNLNSEKNSKRNIRTYGNTKSLKRTELQTTEYEEFPIPDIMKAEPKHENSTKSETSPKNNKNSEMLLHRAERVKIKKFREIPDETNLQTGKDNKNDSDSSNEIIDSNSDYSATNKRKANSEEHACNDNQPKFLNNFSCEVKITEKVSELNNDQPSTVGTPLKNNCPLNPKKLFSKRARERLELQTKAASENNINATNNIEQELNSKDVSDEKIIVNNPCKEVVNNNLQLFSISSPVEEKIGEIENKSIQELVCPNNKEEHLPRVAEEIVKSVESSEKLSKFHKNEIMSNETTENIRSPVKKAGKSKFPKLKIKLDSKSNFLPKNLRKNVKTSPTLKNRKKKKFKSKLNGTSNKNANVKQSEESVEQNDFSNKSELKCDKNIDQNDLDINKNNEIETIGTGEFTSKPEVDKIDEIEDNKTRKEIVEENIDKNLTQSSEEILSNINNKNNKKTNKENINVNSTQSSEEVPSNNEEFPNITIDQDEKKTKLESPQIDKKSAEMVYKPCNKIYEKNFDFYSDHDDGSNSELVIDTSAESSEAEDTVTENKTQEKKNLVQNDIPVSKPKYHHLIEEIVNLNENTNKNIPTNFEHVISHVTEIENPIVEETVVETLNYSDISDEPENSVQDISKNMFEESFQKTEECIVDHVETTDVSISVVEETVVENMIVEESVVENIAVEENIVEDICVKQQNLGEKKKDFVEQTAEIIEIPPDEFFEEIHSEDLIEEKLQLDLEPYGPSVEMIVKVDIGLESCTIFQKTLLEGEHVKETCVKCSVNGKHKNNRRVLVYGLPLYNEQNILKQCLDDCPRIPAIPYRQAVENIEKSPCTLTANVESVKICKDNNIPVSAVKNIEKSACTLTANVESVKICKNNNIPVLAEEIIEKSPCILTALDNSKLVFLANVATNTAHLTTKTDNHNPYPDRPSDNDHNPNSMDIHDKCMIVAFPDDLKPSNKPTTTISVIKDKHTTIPVEIQTLAERIPPKGIVLENKIQEITLERVKNGNRINGENLDELYKSLENICELEINTLTKIPDSHSHLPATILTTIHDNSKISEPIPIDIPNTALLHLTPDDDDFMIHNEPFCLHPKQIQISPVKSSTEAVVVQDKPNLDASGFVNNLFNLANSVTESQKTDNKSTDQKSVNEKQPEVKTKSKRGRKPKSSTNRNSETNYLFNVYKSNQDSNKSVDTNNQQIVNNNKSTPSPQRYIRTTRPMKMVSTKKRNVNVLENIQQEEPPKKVSASEKMFDLLLEEHRKEQSVAKLKTPEKNMEEIISTNNTTLPDLDDKIPESTVITTTLYNDEQHIPLPVLNFEVTESESQKIVTEDINKSDEVLKQKIDNQVVIQTEITEVQTNEEITEHPTNTDITEIKTGNEITEIQTEEDIEVQNNIEITEVQTKKEITEIKTNNKITEIQTEKEITEIQTEKEITEVQTKKEITEIKTNNKITEIQTEKEITEIQTEKEITEIQSIEENTEMLTDKEKQVEGDSAIGEEDPDSSDRNVSAIEVVQDWFNRVHDNKSHTEPYNEITSYQTIEECNFFEEMSNASENSPNSRKTDDKVFSEHQTPDSGIAFDEDSVQKDKSVPENLSDADGEAAATNFDDLDEYISESEKIVISDSQSSYGNQLKVSISLERIQEILPHLKKYKFTSSTEIKIRKRKDHDTEYEKAKKMKYSTEVEQNIIIEEYTSDNDVRIKRRQSCNDDVPEFSNEEVKSPTPSQKDLSAPIRTKGSVKEYPDCLFGITESPVPSGSFHSPYPSDISLTEEPTFYEEGGIDLCNDYPCYDSFEVLQEQQSLQKEYNVVDDNPKDVQQGLQAGYCVVDSQFLPLSEYMNDGDYILIDNKIFNDKKMVPVNMHLVQPETKPHNSEEVKKSEFDDSEKEDSLSDTVEEIIKNPNLFPEQSNSEVQVINMDQATSEVQVVIACGTYQETEMSDTYLFGIAVQSEVNNSDISVPEATLPQHSPMTIEEIPPESKVTDNSDFKPTTPIVGSESTQICNTDILPATDVPQPESVDLLATVAPVPDPIVTDDSLTKKKKLPVHTAESKQIDDIKLKCKPNSAVETQKLNSDKVITRRTSVSEIHVSNAASRTPAYSPPSQVLSKSQNPASNSIQSSSSYNSKKIPKPNCTKSPKMSYELNTTSTTKVVYNLKISEKSPSTSSKVQKLNDLHPRNKVSVLPSSYSAQRLQNAGQKQLAKKLTDLKMQQKPQMTRQAEKTYSSKASEDAFDRLKHDKTDIPPPPDSRRFYSQSNSDPNYLKNRRKDVPSGDYYRRYSIERDSSKSRHPSQSDIRRPHSSHAESNPKQTYRLPASDPSYRSSHNNSRRPEVKKPDQKPPPSGATSSQKDWLKNETLLNLIKASNTIFSKKY